MNKLSEKQKAMIYLGAGLLIFIVFVVMAYLDYKTMEEVDGKTKKLKGEITKATNMKKEVIKKFIPELYKTRDEYQKFQGKLPTSQQILTIMDTTQSWIDVVNKKFQHKQGPMKGWTLTMSGNTTFEGAEKEKEEPEAEAKTTRKRPVRRRARKKKAVNPIKEIPFKGAIIASFHQFCALLQKIEQEERYYVVTDFSIPTLKTPRKKKGETVVDEAGRGSIKFSFVTFSFREEEGKKIEKLAKQLDQYLDPNLKKNKKYGKAAQKAKKDYEESLKKGTQKTGHEELKDQNEWVSLVDHLQDPFFIKVPKEVEEETKQGQPVTIGPGPTTTKNPVENIVAMTRDEFNRSYVKLANLKAQLFDRHAKAKDWSKLRNELNQQFNGDRRDYRNELKQLYVIVTNPTFVKNLGNDFAKEHRIKLKKMLSDYNYWDKKIVEVDWIEDTQEFITKDGNSQIKQMEGIFNDGKGLFENGKKQEAISLLKNGIDTHLKLLTAIKKHEANGVKFKKYEEGQETLNKLNGLSVQSQKMRKNIEDQIKVYNLVQKLTIQGIIFHENKEKGKMSIVIINRKVKRIGEPVEDQGLFVSDIKEDEVVLGYQKITVPIPIPRKIRIKELEERATRNIAAETIR